MRYVEARLEQEYRDEAYRIYVARSLQLIPKQEYISVDYVDMIYPKKKDTRSGDEIALDVIKNAGLSFMN